MDATVWEEVHDIKEEATSEVEKNEDDSGGWSVLTLVVHRTTQKRASAREERMEGENKGK